MTCVSMYVYNEFDMCIRVYFFLAQQHGKTVNLIEVFRDLCEPRAMVRRGPWEIVMLVVLGILLNSVSCETSDSSGVEVESLHSDVLVLDVSNFTEHVEKHPFMVVEFYAPWCGHCKRLAPEYEKAATALKNNDPPIVLAKVDVNEEHNKPLASEFGVKGFPTLKIIRNQGTIVQEYKGPREADGIIAFLQKQVGPPSVQLSSAEHTEEFLQGHLKELVVIGAFESLQGEAFSNFSKIADDLRGEYQFAHILDASHLGNQGKPISVPSVRLIKNFDDGISDSVDFSVEALAAFLDSESLPLVTEMSRNPDDRPALTKFFQSNKWKAFLFTANEGAEEISASNDLRLTFAEIAKSFKQKNIIFLHAGFNESDSALKYFGVETSSLPAVVVQDIKDNKFVLNSAESNQLASWLHGCLEGKFDPYVKSEAIPKTNDEPVKVVVGQTLDEIVLKSGKDVLLEFYAPWCGHCKKLAPTLDEVALSFSNDADVVIAKIDATANDVPGSLFEVKGFPTIFLHSATGKITLYEGDRTKEDIIDFINQHRNLSSKAKEPSLIPEIVQDAVAHEALSEDALKDEL